MLALALALFPNLGFMRVWDKLTAGLRQLCPCRPSEKALRDIRRRLGPAPLKLLFTILAEPAARAQIPGVRYRRWRTVAFDGCSSAKAPDRPRVCGWLGKIKHRYGQEGYPMLKLAALCETGTRALLGAAFGPVAPAESVYAEQLLPLLDDTMLLLNDRGFPLDDLAGGAPRTAEADSAVRHASWSGTPHAYDRPGVSERPRPHRRRVKAAAVRVGMKCLSCPWHPGWRSAGK